MVRKSKASLSPEQLRRIELRSSRQSLGFGNQTGISMPNSGLNSGLNSTTAKLFNEVTQSGETLHDLHQLFLNSEELSDRERQILQFCEQ